MALQHLYYKGHFFIAFYDRAAEHLVEMFDTVKEIVEYKGLPMTRKNCMIVSRELARALRKSDHRTKMLTGKPMTVFIYDIHDEEDTTCQSQTR